MLKNQKLNDSQIDELTNRLSKDNHLLFYSYLTVRRNQATFFGQLNNNKLVAVMAFLKGLPFKAFSFYIEENVYVNMANLISFVKKELNFSDLDIGTTMVTDNYLQIISESDRIVSQKKDYLMKHVDNEKLIKDDIAVVLDERNYGQIKDIASEIKMIAFTANELKKHPFVGILHNDKIVAVAGYHIYNEKIVEVGNIGTIKDKRGKGYGKIVSSAITRLGKEKSENVYLYVFTDNYPAIKAYETIGYKTIKELNFIEFKLSTICNGLVRWKEEQTASFMLTE